MSTLFSMFRIFPALIKQPSQHETIKIEWTDFISLPWRCLKIHPVITRNEFWQDNILCIDRFSFISKHTAYGNCQKHRGKKLNRCRRDLQRKCFCSSIRRKGTNHIRVIEIFIRSWKEITKQRRTFQFKRTPRQISKGKKIKDCIVLRST